MNPRILTRAELVTFAKIVAAKVAAGKVTGFLSGQNTTFSNALIDGTGDLAAKDAKQSVKRAESKSATQEATDAHKDVIKQLTAIKFGMRSVGAPASEYEALGFDPPAERAMRKPETPTELAATGFSNGVNVLRFKGNNKPGSLTYVIEAKTDKTAPYVIVGTSMKQSFRHTGVTPGQFCQYRVRAQAARGRISDWSNEAVVYGSSS